MARPLGWWSPDREGSGATSMPTDHNVFTNLILQIADLLRGPYRPPKHERVMLPVTMLRRLDCVLAEVNGTLGWGAAA